MAYQPVANDHVHQPIQLDNIDPNTRHSSGTSEHAQDNDSELGQDDKKSEPALSPGRKWPVEPQQVVVLTPSRVGMMVFDTILASTPIMFIALASIAARLNGKEVSTYGRKVEETLLLSPTIFPLIFAALMGRFFRYMGLYLAERGTTLGRLEHLVGCQSVFTALERQIAFRSWSAIGLFTVLVWLLSPVGGQSALRLIGQENNNVSSIVTVHYIDPLSAKNSFLLDDTSSSGERATFRSIFLAALLSSSKYQDTPMDLWGNVKLPTYRYIENTTSDEWKPVRGSNATYGSLIGVPINGMPAQGYSSFNIKARQFDITCSSNEMLSGVKNSSIFANVTSSTWGLMFDPSKEGHGREYPRPILSISLVEVGSEYSNYSVAACFVNYNHLEAKINCNGTSCGVDSMRKLDLLSDGYGLNTDLETRWPIMLGIMFNMPRVDNEGVGVPAPGSTNAEKWMADPTDFIGKRYNNVQLYKLDPETFARRLTILWNTFHQSTFATTSLGGALARDLTVTGMLSGDYTWSTRFKVTQAEMLQQALPVYKINWKWFVALLFSSLVLLVAAYAGLILKYITLAPDIIGYASSLTMLNPYVPTPTGGTTLHGLERAALLHDLPVRIGDVCANEPIGAIAFAKADDGRVARLDQRRWYI